MNSNTIYSNGVYPVEVSHHTTVKVQPHISTPPPPVLYPVPQNENHISGAVAVPPPEIQNSVDITAISNTPRNTQGNTPENRPEDIGVSENICRRKCKYIFCGLMFTGTTALFVFFLLYILGKDVNII